MGWAERVKKLRKQNRKEEAEEKASDIRFAAVTDSIISAAGIALTILAYTHTLIPETPVAPTGLNFAELFLPVFTVIYSGLDTIPSLIKYFKLQKANESINENVAKPRRRDKKHQQLSRRLRIR